MIVFVTTASHRYTHREIAQSLAPFRQATYPMVLTRSSLPFATYIFSDLDRLNFWQLELAAHVFRALRAAGCRVLNDPAVALQRLALLRRLHANGLNSFTAWPALERETVDRFPVFARTESAHRGVLTDLLEDRETLEAAIRKLVEQGHPLADLIVVQYCAEPIHADVFRKLSVYRLGETLVPALSVHERSWCAKYGEDGVAGELAYDEDLERVKTNPHGAAVLRAFQAACIDYGRADFGLVRGRPEIYEINTNPMIERSGAFRFPARAQAAQLSQMAYDKAMLALDTPQRGRRVRISRPEIWRKARRRKRLAPGYGWMP